MNLNENENDPDLHTNMSQAEAFNANEPNDIYNVTIVSQEDRKVEEDDLTFAGFLWNRVYCKYILPLLVVAGATVGIMVAAGVQFDKDKVPFANLIFSRNGWRDVNVEEIPRWNTQGSSSSSSGVPLQLEVLNGLDDSWQSYFAQAIVDWNNGDPDVVELSVTKVDPDAECDFVRGKIAICNGDYGPTDFHGMNHILVSGNTITASLAKLNEHYLHDASQARKQYTICHEIGHGFGLPHSDENHFNINLGNCMDYTDRPWSNTAPDKFTFELLHEIYDTVPTPDSSNAGSMLTTTTASSNTRDGNSEGVDAASTSDDIPDWVRKRAKEAAVNLETAVSAPGNNNNDSGEAWVQQQRDDNTAAFRIDLGDGFSLHTHFLLTN